MNGERRETPGRGAAITQAGERRSARIESLRALAALSVLLSHAYVTAHLAQAGGGAVLQTDAGPYARLVTAGRLGVFLFFALTGYLLFWPFARLYFGSGDRVDLRRYALNRALRILPLYFAVVTIVTFWQHGGGTMVLWFRDLTLTQNLSQFTASKVDAPIWSVIVEVHFYILLPLIAVCLAWLARGSLRRAAIAVLALGLVAMLARSYLVQMSSDPNTLWRFSLPATFIFFIPGLLLALLRLRWEDRPAGWLKGPLGRSDLWLLASVPVWLLVVETNQFRDALVLLACFLVLGACVLPLRAGSLTNSLQWRPLALVGVASYSLYLWHLPILSALRSSGIHGFAALVAAGVPLAIAAAFISYTVIETPFLRLRGQWSGSAARQERQRGAVPKPAQSEVRPETVS